MLPRLGTSAFVTRWIIATIALSIIATRDSGWLIRWLALAPTRVFQGEVWRLVTWPLIELGPLCLILTCVAIYKFGSELAVPWGDRRLQRFMLEVVFVAGAVTCLLALLVGNTYVRHVGGWAIGDVLVIAWARQFPHRELILYGLIRVQGQQLINMTVGATALYAIYAGPIAVAPELVGCATAVLYPQSMLRR